MHSTAKHASERSMSRSMRTSLGSLPPSRSRSNSPSCSSSPRTQGVVEEKALPHTLPRRTLSWSSPRGHTTTGHATRGRDSRLSVQTRLAEGGALSVIGDLVGELTFSFNIVLLVMILIIAFGVLTSFHVSLAIVVLAVLGWGAALVYLDTTRLIVRALCSLFRACALAYRSCPRTARPRPGEQRLGLLDPEMPRRAASVVTK